MSDSEAKLGEDLHESVRPHLERLKVVLQERSQKINAMILRPHDAIGLMLKAHLIIEHFLDEHLIKRHELTTLHDAQLSFFQKASLLRKGKNGFLLKPGILELNKLRNDFGHNIEAELDKGRMPKIIAILKELGMDIPERLDLVIVLFTSFACHFLDCEVSNSFSNVLANIMSDYSLFD